MLLTGTNGDDTLTGGIGDDQIFGLDGDDELDGNAGADSIDGGSGNDSITGGTGDDAVLGSGGNDVLDGGFGNDTVDGGDGDDRFDDWTGTNTFIGGLGNDYFVLRMNAADVNSSATGGGGQDTYDIQTQQHNNVFSMAFTVTDFAAGASGDLLDFSAILDRSAEMGAYSGGNAFDPAQGFLRLVQSGADTLVQWDRDGAAEGVYTWATQVTLENVTATALTGDNVVGGLHPDGTAVLGETINGTGVDTLTGTFGDDVINGFGGNDRLDGRPGADQLNGGLGNDTFVSGAGDDSVAGGEGNDTFIYFKSYGNDTLLGEAGDDIFYDLYGDNILNGGDGADLFSIFFNGEFASSTVATGGAGRDEYEFVDIGPQDSYVITDFEVGSLGDFIDIYGLLLRSDGYTGGNPFDPVLGYVRLETVGDDTLFQHDVDGSAANAGTWKTILTLQGVTTGFTAENFDGIPPDGSPVPGESLTGTAGADNLTGGFFNDTISGLEGTDQLDGAGGDDLLDGGADEDVLVGGLGSDTLIGGTENDILNGSSGDDRVFGGAGNDSFYEDRGADVLNGGAGADYFRTAIGYASTLTGGGGQDEFEFLLSTFSNVFASITDFVAGVNGDQLDIDSLVNYSAQIGGYSGGNPFASNLGYLRLLQSGSDTVLQWDIDGVAGSEYAWQSIIRLAGVDRDTITSDNFAGKLLVGTAGDDELVGGLGNDTLQGLGGDDLLDGSIGADSMVGGTGGDTYLVDNAGDVVLETSNAASLGESPAAAGNLTDFTDTVVAVVTYSLEEVAFVENLTLSGTAIAGTGNALNNVITGNALANVLSGLAGNDTIKGGAGNDTLAGGSGADSMVGGTGNDKLAGTTGYDVLIGGIGNDILAGGSGNDRLTGGTGADKFDFNSALHPVANVDRIVDFDVDADRIRLDNDAFTAFTAVNVTLTAGAFYSGAGKTQAHDASDRIIYNTTTGSLYYDADGQGGTAEKLFATLVNEAAITHTDFFIVA